MIGKNFGLPILRLYVTYWGMLGKAFIAILPTIINLGKIIGNALPGASATPGVGYRNYSRPLLPRHAFPCPARCREQGFPGNQKRHDATVGAAFRDHMDVIRAFGQVFLFVLKAIGVALAVLGLLLVKVVIPVIAKLLTVVLGLSVPSSGRSCLLPASSLPSSPV
jgi:hypothetical protein